MNQGGGFSTKRSPLRGFLAVGYWLLAIGQKGSVIRCSMPHAPSPMLHARAPRPHPCNPLKSVKSSSSTQISSKRGGDNIDHFDHIDHFSAREQGNRRKEKVIVFIVFIVSQKMWRGQGTRFKV
jgi:hypothetical protein